MNRTKRQEQGILIHFSLYLSLFIILVCFFLLYAYPQILSIENKKEEVHSLHNEILNVSKTGLNFSDFKEKTKSLSGANSLYTQEIINSIESDFYTTHLQNDTTKEYSVFLTDKKKDLSLATNDKDANELLVSEILPSYIDAPIDSDDEFLTDFKFINYVESIFETFNLSHSDSIGIKDVVLLEEFSSNDKKKQSLETNIFSIPVSVTLEGTKGGMISFLKYIEGVGKVSIEEDIISVQNEVPLEQGGRKVILKGDRFTSNYNIYEHQIIDIDSIRIKDYIDRSYKLRGSSDSLEEFLSETGQLSDNILVDVKLLFYVKGIPNYKIKDFITSVIQMYNKVKKQAQVLIKKKENIDNVELKNINTTLKEIERDITEMKAGIGKLNNLNDLYRKASIHSQYLIEKSAVLQEFNK